MASIPNNYISAALFDLKQDIIADIPRDIIERWLASGQAREDALAILEPFKVQGYVLSSDTSGLSKLSGQKSLIEVLSIVSYPKEIVYAHGVELGGKAIGVWAADNTQMFFGDDIEADRIVAAARKILTDIEQYCQVKIGIGIHYGTFYQLGGGLYGEDADFVEHFTEDFVKGGELWISDTFKDRLRNDYVCVLVPEQPRLYRVMEGAISMENVSFDVEYPLPFSREFYNDLRLLRGSDNFSNYLSELEARYLREVCVVLVERERGLEDGAREVGLLHDLSLCAVMENDAEDLLALHHGEEIKTAGPLGIYVFDASSDAIAFACEFRSGLSAKSLSCRIGVDRGNVLICALPHGTKDIAGEPVNIASKLAQDAGVFGSVYVSGRCKHALLSDQKGENIAINVSGVTIEAVKL